MTDYENMIISAVRYALGRMTYIVSLTVNYVLKDIEKNKLSKYCLSIMKKDIESEKYLGMDFDEKDWQRLLKKIDTVLEDDKKDDNKKMCKFCKKQKGMKKNHFDIKLEKNYLIIGNECSEGCGYAKEEIKIKYCPFCGELLKK